MDFGTLEGIWTLAVLIAFVAIVIWAWSGKRKRDFEEAGRIPMDDDSNPPADR